MKRRIAALAALICSLILTLTGMGLAQEVTVKHLPDEREVLILMDGRLFTVYRFGPGFQTKPIFYPILTPDGRSVNRGFPMESIPGEPTDHPHQKSLFFAYGNVNGVDFWNEQEGSGIVHREIARVEGGGQGLLQILLDWVMPDGTVVLDEIRTVRFGGEPGVRWIDQESVLAAQEEPVTFGDSKEGLFAIRVASALQEQGGVGQYENAFGSLGEAEVWGRRAPWVALRGEVEGGPVTLAIFDHPSSEQHPAHWHARGYGLFSVNPLGRKEFDPDAEALNRRLEPGESLHFRYRFLLYEEAAERERLSRDYEAFASNGFN